MKTTPNFAAWEHSTLAKLAAELFEENQRLRTDNKTLLEQWRKLVKETANA